jgi:hypothetical protein
MARLPIDTDPTPMPGIKVYYLPDDVLVVGIYPDTDHGTVYRWEDGPDAPPVVIEWRARTRGTR